MDYLITFEDGSDGYLSHHGVLGMKWGVRNAETKARYANEGRGKSGGHSSGSSSGNRKGLSDGQKRALKTAAIGLGTAAAIGGGVYLARRGGLKKLNEARKTAIKAAKTEHAKTIANVTKGERQRFNDAVSEQMRKTARNRYRTAPNLGQDPRYSKLNRVTNAELHARETVMGRANEETRTILPKNEALPKYTDYYNESQVTRGVAKASRHLMNNQIDTASKTYKRGKRRVDILTGAGGILAIGSGTGAGAAYNASSKKRGKKNRAA